VSSPNVLWGDDTFVNFDQGLNFGFGKIRAVLEETPIHLDSSKPSKRGLSFHCRGKQGRINRCSRARLSKTFSAVFPTRLENDSPLVGS